MAIQLGYQRLAETHHFTFAFALGIEVAAAFPPAHWQGGEGVFKGLLKAKELKDRQVYRRVEAHAALKWADSRVKLHAPGAVDLHLILIIYPYHAKLDHPLRLYQPLKQRHLTIVRICFKKWPERGHHLANGLRKLALMRVALLNMGEK